MPQSGYSVRFLGAANQAAARQWPANVALHSARWAKASEIWHETSGELFHKNAN